MKLIVLAAGKGTRFSPITDEVPKGMILVLGKPLLSYVIKPYLPYVSEIIFVINKSLEYQIKDYFRYEYFGHSVIYRYQEKQEGTMDALMTCKDIINSNEIFCVCNCDDLLKESEVKKFLGKKELGLGVTNTIAEKSYHDIEVKDNYIYGFRKHNTKSEYINGLFFNGFRVLNYKVFDLNQIQIIGGEISLASMLLYNLDNYPMKAFNFKFW